MPSPCQPDGKLVIGGEFFKYDDIPSRRIARLNPNGSLDFAFNPGKGANDEIQCVLVQPDGKIIFGGEFSAMNGINIDHIVRLYGAPVDFQSVSWSDVDLTVNESERTQTLVVRRYGPATNTITVNYSTSDGSATAGGDYTAQSGAITLNPPEVTKTITVAVHDDGIPEEDEKFYVTAVPATPGVEQGSIQLPQFGSGTTKRPFTWTMVSASRTSATGISMPSLCNPMEIWSWVDPLATGPITPTFSACGRTGP